MTRMTDKQCLRSECVRHIISLFDAARATAAPNPAAREVVARAYERTIRGLPYPSPATVASVVVAALVEAGLLPEEKQDD